MRKITWILMLMLAPEVAFAFMDAPTITTIFPAYLILLVPLVVYEVAYVSRKISASKTNVFKAGILVHLLALVIMILGGWVQGWLQTYVRHKLIEIIDLKTIGIFTLLHDPPSAIDIMFSLSIGSVVLIQDAAYRWLNIIVIIVFLLPTFLLSTYFGIRIFNWFIPNADKTRIEAALIQIKGIEYGSLVIASFMYLNFVYQL
jgi:hypothetical protein